MGFVRGMLVAALALGAFEAGSRQAGWLDPTQSPDPYLGFPGTSPLFAPERGPDGTAVMRTATNKRDSVYRDSRFPVPKPAGEYRVFCIGGSSVRSEIWLNPDGSFPGLLATELWGRLPGVTPRVINCGGGGQGSVQNLEVLREVLDDEPDLIVVYPEGGEKNTIPPSPQAALALKDDESPLRADARRCLNRLRSYQAAKLAYQALLPHAPAGGDVSSAFSALATFAVSRPYKAENFIRPFEMKLEGVPVLMEHPIPPAEIERAHARFLRNLEEMAALCKERGVPLLFVQPVRNLEAVFYLRFHIAPAEVQPGRLSEWQQLYEQAVALRHERRWEEALVALNQVRRLYVEDRDELAAFLSGDCLLQLGRPAEALREFERPYLQHPMRELIERAGREAGVPVVDPYPGVLAISTGGIPGYEEFTDSFHPMPKVNRAIAVAIADAMAAAGVGPPQRPADSQERAAASARLDQVIAGIPIPLHTAIVSAILHGDPQKAIELGRTLPEAEMMTMQPVTAVYLGWALAKSGDDVATREWYRKLREQTSYGRSKNLPPLNTDEDIVRNAFAGDVFAWF